MRRCGTPWASLSLVLLAAASAGAQGERRERKDPGLLIDTPGRLAACDALTFTDDGKRLLAAGDDKAVFVWDVKADELALERKLRWGIFREKRGAIYALALHRAADGLRVAVGGVGRQIGQVAVFDAAKGEIEHAYLPEERTGNGAAVWAIAFAADGRKVAFGSEDGGVWLWTPDGIKSGGARRLGPPPAKKENNRVVFVVFDGADGLYSLAHDGRLLRWDLRRPDAAPRPLFRVATPRPNRVALSADRRRLAIVGDSLDAEVRSFPDGGETQTLKRPSDLALPNCVAFDRSGRLAVGWRYRFDVPFFLAQRGEVRLYDVAKGDTRGQIGPSVTYTPEALAFTPDGRRLAVAGGDDYEVVVWNLAPLRRVAEARSPGQGLWGVALSADGKKLGLQADRVRDGAPDGPNRLGRGPYRVFDLERRDWAAANAKFEPVRPSESEGGWRVRLDPKDAMHWDVVGPGGERWPLDLSRVIDDFPTCYTFLRATTAKPVRLVVGHYWGLSLFELDARHVVDGRLKRTRVYHGHQGYVTSVAADKEQHVLVSASRDQTVSAWSLDDWPNQRELGADFERDDKDSGKLVVKAVASGSPAWEAGLSKDDRVILTHVGGDKIGGGPAQWQTLLEQTKPYRELLFDVWRDGKRLTDPSKSLYFQTTVRQRPLWRFFPMKDNEWVLWRWHDYYYDTSTNGDRFLGWQVNNDAAEKPVFHAAEQLRDRFYRPDKVQDLLRRAADPVRGAALLREIEPPAVTLTLTPPRGPDANLTVTFEATPAGGTALGELQEIERVELWVNGDRLRTWNAPRGRGPFRQAGVVIPATQLPVGDNTLTVIAVNRGDASGQRKESFAFTSVARKDLPTLHGLLVGINDYGGGERGARRRRDLPIDLKARNDAEKLTDLWGKIGRQTPYGRTTLGKESLLGDREATPKAILARLRDLKDKVKPDDQFVFFLGGHGHVDNDPNARGGGIVSGTFRFVGPFYDVKKVAETTLSAKDLYDALAEIHCHKIVLIDACHSGDLTANPVRELRRNGVGAVVLSACKNTESAIEHTERGHGFFTLTVLDALAPGTFQADANRDGIIAADELARFVCAEVPRRVEAYVRAADEEVEKFPQHPQVSPPLDELRHYQRRLATKTR